MGSWTSALGASRLAMLGVAGAAGIGVIAIKGAVEAAVAEERNIAKLNASLKANIAGWDGNTAAIERRVLEGEKLAFSDDEQRASLALLVGSTKDVTKAQTLQATAMDLARFKSIGLEEASTALIKVENGQFRALKALGIKLREGATATEALAAVQKVAGGQAVAYANTAGGAMDSLGIVIGDLSEDFGAMLLPIIKDLAIFARDDLVPAIRDVAEVIGGIIDAVGEATSAIEGFNAGPLEVFADVLNGLQKGFFDAGVAVREGLLGPVDKGFTEVALIAARTNKAMAAEMRDTAFGDAVGIGIVDPLVDGMEDAKDEAVRIAARVPIEIANAMRDKRTTWQKAVDQLKDDAENSMSETVEIAKIKGQLAAIAMSQGWRSGDAVWITSLVATRDALNTRLRELQGSALRSGINANAALAAGLRGPAPAAALRALNAEASSVLSALPPKAYTWGTRIPISLKNGIYAATATYTRSIANLSTLAAKYLQFASPAELGAFSKGGGPEGWGEKMTDLMARGVRRGIPGLHDVLGDLGSVPMTMTAGTAGASGFGTAGGAGGDAQPFVIENRIFLDGRQITEAVEVHRYYATAAAPR